jgi:hypothetical protein
VLWAASLAGNSRSPDILRAAIPQAKQNVAIFSRDQLLVVSLPTIATVGSETSVAPDSLCFTLKSLLSSKTSLRLPIHTKGLRHLQRERTSSGFVHCNNRIQCSNLYTIALWGAHNLQQLDRLEMAPGVIDLTTTPILQVGDFGWDLEERGRERVKIKGGGDFTRRISDRKARLLHLWNDHLSRLYRTMHYRSRGYSKNLYYPIERSAGKAQYCCSRCPSSDNGLPYTLAQHACTHTYMQYLAPQESDQASFLLTLLP